MGVGSGVGERAVERERAEPPIVIVLSSMDENRSASCGLGEVCCQSSSEAVNHTTGTPPSDCGWCVRSSSAEPAIRTVVKPLKEFTTSASDMTPKASDPIK